MLLRDSTRLAAATRWQGGLKESVRAGEAMSEFPWSEVKDGKGASEYMVFIVCTHRWQMSE